MAGNLGVCDGAKGDVVLVKDAVACWEKSEDPPFDAETIRGVYVESLREFASIAKTHEVVQVWGDRS